MNKICILQDKKSCLRRSLDATNIRSLLSQNGNIILGEKDKMKANYFVIVTCGFNEVARNDGKLLIECAKKIVDEDRILVIGCLPGIMPDYFVNSAIHYINPSNYHKLEDVLKKMKIISDNIGVDLRQGSFGLMQQDVSLSSNLYYLNVASGCLGNCSYCAIKKAIGKLRSRTLDSLINESKIAISQGAEGIYLGADDLGAWGLDIKKSFPELLFKLLMLSGDASMGNYYIDLRNVINPNWIVKYIDKLEKIFYNYHERLPCISLAMQSGSSNILKLYHRFNDVSKILNSVNRIYAVNTKLYGFGHMMVGCPDESEDDILKSLKFIEDSPIQFWTCFKFAKQKINETCRNQIDTNWSFFLDRVHKSGLIYKIDNNRIYVSKEINEKYIVV